MTTPNKKTLVFLVVSEVVKPEIVNQKMKEYLEQSPSKIFVRPIDAERVVISAEYESSFEEIVESFE